MKKKRRIESFEVRMSCINRGNEEDGLSSVVIGGFHTKDSRRAMRSEKG